MSKLDMIDDALGLSADEIVSPTATVSNTQPRITSTKYRLAIIGEAPGRDEVEQQKLFVGYSGRLLDQFLSRYNILRDSCFLGSVCQHQAPGGNLASFEWDGPQIQTGLSKLREDLLVFAPHCVLLLGGGSLHAFRNPLIVPRKKKSKLGMVFGYPDSLDNWRGSFFTGHMTGPGPGLKCIATHHPLACLRNFEWTPLMSMDIKRAFDESTSAVWQPPQRNLKINLSFAETVHELEKLLETKAPVATDIEGYWNNWTCISFAPSRDYAFIVPFTGGHNGSYWSVDEEVTILGLVAKVLAHPQITKIWQNGLYDRFCTQYGYGLVVRGRNNDIMLKHWELHCELEKALSVQCSLYTKEPYYKSERKVDNMEIHHRYCCRDSCVTKEIDEKLSKWMAPESQRHYLFNETLLNSLLYMELRGIKYNHEGAAKRLIEVNSAIYELQYKIDEAAGRGLGTTDKGTIRRLLVATMCYVKDTSRVKKDFEETYTDCCQALAGDQPLTSAQLGMLSVSITKARSKLTEARKELVPSGLNIRGKGLKEFLYDDLDLPRQYDPVTGNETVNYYALLTLSKKSDDPVIPYIIEANELRTRSQMLHIATDSDGRVRSSYNEVGSETGRVTSGTSPTGSGYNLQTIPDENELKSVGHPLHSGMRDLLLADDGCYLAKCDLKGADGWTVGANLAALGDSTMLDDLRFGLKPASVLCYASRHGPSAISGKTRPELMELCREVKKSDWDYFAYKQCIWGFCYLMGVRKAVQHVFNVSEGTVLVAQADMQMAKDMLFKRYNIGLWHRATEQRLFKQPYPPKLLSPSGHIREFFGRKSDIVGQALAHEPQSITTYATNMAVFNCWTDPENRSSESVAQRSLSQEQEGVGESRPTPDRPRCVLRVEPMHQVHDEFLCQFRIDDAPWAVSKIKQWFNNEIVINGIPVTIPFEGAYGTDWSMSGQSKKGSI